ncbi:hypothetical protein SEA_LILYPAD_49 [Gordonia phage LilyPad]|nr:hypothetical protein SEA_LILYPAD_49 [Gordonia phage LilyPad]
MAGIGNQFLQAEAATLSRWHNLENKIEDDRNEMEAYLDYMPDFHYCELDELPILTEALVATGYHE